MMRILKYSNIIILFFFTACLFTEPINKEVTSNFTYTSDLLVNMPVSLEYINKDDAILLLDWSIEERPEYSSLENNSFLPSNNINKQVFLPDTPGDYVVSLRVEDDYHSISITKKTITIKNNPPVAVITSLNDGEDFKINRELFFDSSSSYDIDYNKLISFKWSVIDAPKGNNILGTTSEESIFKIIPNTKGNYTIKLVVEDITKVENYSTYSFYIEDEPSLKILETIPDNNINLIPLNQNSTKKFSVILTDDTLSISDLEYSWYVSINEEDYFLLSNNNELDLNCNTYGIGDILSIKLSVSSGEYNSIDVFWRVVIIE
jgi:hypothetical protein